MEPKTKFVHYGLPVDGWFFSPKFRYYQKVVGQAIVYMERMLGHYRLLLYRKGEPIVMCTMEARIYEEYGPERLFDLGLAWLEKYQGWDKAALVKDKYFLGNPDGVWGKQGQALKLHYLNNQLDWDKVLKTADQLGIKYKKNSPTPGLYTTEMGIRRQISVEELFEDWTPVE
ncbi:MAG: hypothetical protein JWM44_1539 [Bacilli bacterium]|nr:hypothetical protein [Bacilli bacterium]